MRVRQRGFNRSDVKWRSFPYSMLIVDMNMMHIFKKERPHKVHATLKRIGVIRW